MCQVCEVLSNESTEIRRKQAATAQKPGRRLTTQNKTTANTKTRNPDQGLLRCTRAQPAECNTRALNKAETKRVRRAKRALHAPAIASGRVEDGERQLLLKVFCTSTRKGSQPRPKSLVVPPSCSQKGDRVLNNISVCQPPAWGRIHSVNRSTTKTRMQATTKFNSRAMHPIPLEYPHITSPTRYLM